jgi:cell division protein FtsW (lipid II flippase)
MSILDERNPAKTILLLVLLMIFAQVDLGSAAGWPLPLLNLLHLTPAPNDLVRGCCAGIGASIDFLAVFAILRIVARRALSFASPSNN